VIEFGLDPPLPLPPLPQAAASPATATPTAKIPARLLNLPRFVIPVFLQRNASENPPVAEMNRA
jgi:hypothetical protein